jgi:hypothetical protein
MKQLILFSLIGGLVCLGGERKQLPGQAGNDQVDFEASVLLTRAEVTEAIGNDLGDGYIVVRMKVIPKGEAPVRVGPDDFTMISRKDGQKCQALTPSEIAGKGTMVVKHGTADGGKSSWGVGGMGGGLGSSPGTVQRDVIKNTQIDDTTKEGPALAALAAKILPDKESKTPTEGLLYFSLTTTKLKPKDVALIYNGAAGKLVMEFQPLKK